MALVGAFATGEYLPVPAIPAEPQAPRAGALSHEAAAVAYAQTLWQSADLNQDTAASPSPPRRRTAADEPSWAATGNRSLPCP